MTGEELVKLGESRAFRQNTMDSIINEFVPEPNQFLMTDAFMPFKLVDKDVMIDLINHGAFGRTQPVNLGAEHAKIALSGFGYKEHTAGHWRESVMFNEEVLQKSVDPAKPTDRWGEGLVTAALNLLDTRLNNLIEYLTAKVLINGSYSEARYGVNYTYDPKIPAKFMKNVTSSPGWTSGGTWNTAANATPSTDVIEAANLLRRAGVTPVAVHMNVSTLRKYYAATDTQNMLKSSPGLVEKSANRELVFTTLTGMPIVLDDRLYSEETRFTAASAIGDTVLDVVNAGEFVAGDVLTLRNSLMEEEEVTIASISSNAITVGAVTKAYQVGDRVTAYKNFMPNDYFIIRGESNQRIAANNWISTPSLVKGGSWTNPVPGRYTWRYFQVQRPPYTAEIGAGIDGGPRVSAPSWMRVKVVA